MVLENRRRMISAAVIFFLMFVNQCFMGPFSKIALNLLIWVTYSVFLFIPKSWWTVITVLILIMETTAGVYWFHERILIYLLVVIVLSAAIQLSFAKSPIPAMVVLLVTSIFYSRFGTGSLFNLISFIFLAIVLYFTIRIRIQRNEMYDELKDAYEQLQDASVTSMQYAILEERTRIAREIHDSVGHSLTSLIVQMQALKYMLKEDPEEAKNSLDGMLVVARQGLEDIRTSVHSLADDQAISGVTPLKALLTRMEESASIQYEFFSNVEELNDNMNRVLFRVLQEAITNVIRHSEATKVWVSLTKETGKMVMRIRDNGIVKVNHKVKQGFGLKVMKARLEEIGGQLNYSILEPNGFEITAEIPLEG